MTPRDNALGSTPTAPCSLTASKMFIVLGLLKKYKYLISNNIHFKAAWAQKEDIECTIVVILGEFWTAGLCCSPHGRTGGDGGALSGVVQRGRHVFFTQHTSAPLERHKKTHKHQPNVSIVLSSLSKMPLQCFYISSIWIKNNLFHLVFKLRYNVLHKKDGVF